MRLFLSYASEQLELAEGLSQRLRNAGVDVYLDRDRLVAGDAYDAHIRKAIARSDLFVFLATRDSLRHGAYPLAELAIAQRKWPRAAGSIVPVLVGDIEIESLPAYLRSVSVLKPRGDLSAEVLDTVARLRARRRVKRLATSLLFVVTAAVALLVWQWLPGEAPGLSIRRVAVVKELDGYRFDVTVHNETRERVTVVRLQPQANIPTVRFSGSFEWFEVNSGQTRDVSVVYEILEALRLPLPSFDWRMCQVVVKSLDLEMARDIKPFDRFVSERGHEVCTKYRRWDA